MRLLLPLLFLSFSVCGQLSRTEKKIVTAVEQQETEALNLLKTVVNMNSGTMNFDGVREVGKVFGERFEALGFKTSWVNGDSFNRAGHLVAVYEGKPGSPRLLLIGHLDTVFEPDHPNQTYTMMGDSVMLGPGVVDMKGGNVIILHALSALKEAGVLDNLSIEVVMTGDEERSGSPIELSKKAIRDAAGRADLALGFENGDSQFETAVISRRSSSGWTLKVKGRPAHSSQIFSEDVGAGAIYETARILQEFYETLRQEEYLTFNPGVILGGTSVTEENGLSGGKAYGKNNVVAETVVVHGDIRAVSSAQLEKARSIMTDIIEKNYPHTSAEISFNEGGYPPMDRTESNRDLLKKYSQVSQDLDLGVVSAVEPINAGAADISFAADLVDGAIDGLGLSGGKDHTADEYGNIYMLGDTIKRAALLMYRLGN
jgi:glutamate carboxypeptidase